MDWSTAPSTVLESNKVNKSGACLHPLIVMYNAYPSQKSLHASDWSLNVCRHTDWSIFIEKKMCVYALFKLYTLIAWMRIMTQWFCFGTEVFTVLWEAKSRVPTKTMHTFFPHINRYKHRPCRKTVLTSEVLFGQRALGVSSGPVLVLLQIANHLRTGLLFHGIESPHRATIYSTSAYISIFTATLTANTTQCLCRIVAPDFVNLHWHQCAVIAIYSNYVWCVLTVETEFDVNISLC